MALPLALPLAPVAWSAGASGSAAAATFVVGSSLFLADAIYGFRRSDPTLPPITGLEGEATLAEKIADYLAGARVPVGSPPPPPLKPKIPTPGPAPESAGLWERFSDGLSQLWGWFNGRPKESGYDPGPELLAPILGTVPPAGNTIGATLRIVRTAGSARYIRISGSNPEGSVSVTPSDFTVANVTRVDGVVFVRQSNGNHTAGLRYVNSNNVVSINGPSVGTDREFVTFTPQYTLTWNHPSAVPFPNDESSFPLPDGYTAPKVDPATTPLPAAPPPLPLPAPSTVPDVEPEVQPEVAPVEPGPARVAPPVAIPAPRPLPLPGADTTRVTVRNGRLPATTTAPAPTTDPGSIIPWPGAAPIPGTGVGPAPNLVGIAQELGRIERKLEVMNTPNAPGNLVDRFGNLADLIGPLVEAILAATSGTTYTLDSPCEVDSEGNRLPAIEVQAPGALTQFGAILNRLDALAELLQVHKDLKQPNCRGADVPVGGEFVTVNFEQID